MRTLELSQKRRERNLLPARVSVHQRNNCFQENLTNCKSEEIKRLLCCFYSCPVDVFIKCFSFYSQQSITHLFKCIK